MIIGTAGHVDHGKSTLVEALTGRPMDRLAEEKMRGITIELNFAPLILPGGVEAGMVDVPGHEDFVQNMVAGASGLDLVLLIVAADEGIMPQTREHRAIIEQLAVPQVLPVITKCDLVEPDWLELVGAELEEWGRPSPVTWLPPVAVSARSGTGIERLRSSIGEALRGRPSRDRADLFRMPVDRVFSVAGTGTVITGTTWSGQIEVGQQLRLLPQGLDARVRSIESFGRNVGSSQPGARTAIGLAGIDRDQVRRGDLAVAASDHWLSSLALDVQLDLPPNVRLAERSRVRVHLGTAEALARVYWRGESGARQARLVLETPLTGRGGDRFVLRSFSPVTTIGGGRILDPAPPRRGASWPPHLSDEDPSKRLEGLASRRRWGMSSSEIPLLVGVSPAASIRLLAQPTTAIRLGDQLVSADLIQQLSSAVLAQVKRWHQANRFDGGMPASAIRQTVGGSLGAPLLDRMVAGKSLEAVGSQIRLPGFRPTPRATSAEVETLTARLMAEGLAVSTVGELERETGRRDLLALLRMAAAAGQLTAVGADRFVAPAALAEFVAILKETGATGTITPGALRARTGLTRKHLIPLLEWADQAGHTRREGEGRTLVRRP